MLLPNIQITMTAISHDGDIRVTFDRRHIVVTGPDWQPPSQVLTPSELHELGLCIISKNHGAAYRGGRCLKCWESKRASAARSKLRLAEQKQRARAG